MEIIGTYQDGFTPEKNIECKIKIDKYGIEIIPINSLLYEKIKRPKDKSDYLPKRFVGDKRFPYTWTIEYKDEENKVRELLTEINILEYWKIKWIKKELPFQKNNKSRGFHIAVVGIVVVIIIAMFQMNQNKVTSSSNKKTINRAADSSLIFHQDSSLLDTIINL